VQYAADKSASRIWSVNDRRKICSKGQRLLFGDRLFTLSTADESSQVVVVGLAPVDRLAKDSIIDTHSSNPRVVNVLDPFCIACSIKYQPFAILLDTVDTSCGTKGADVRDRRIKLDTDADAYISTVSL
jgi:hypothetical protein